MKLSVCLATFNEEKFIRYPLDSVKDFADEIVIVDGGSSDKTLEIAHSYGEKVRIIQTDNPPMFHINKQKALDAAQGDWILQLDADEAVSDELKKEIQGILDESVDLSKTDDNQFKFAAYWIPRKNFFLTRFLMKGGQYPDYTIRFYRRGAVRFPCKSVHENVELINTNSHLRQDYGGQAQVRSPAFAEASAGKPKPESGIPNSEFRSLESNYTELNVVHHNVDIAHDIGYLNQPLLHYADPDFSRYLKRWDRYTTLDAQLAVQSPAFAEASAGKPKSPLRQDYGGQAEVRTDAIGFIQYFFLKPFWTFFMMYFRHKGFMDGFPGFVFALFSAIRFWLIYIKVWCRANAT